MLIMKPDRISDLAERNSEEKATRVDAAQEAQDRPRSKLRALWEGLIPKCYAF